MPARTSRRIVVPNRRCHPKTRKTVEHYTGQRTPRALRVRTGHACHKQSTTDRKTSTLSCSRSVDTPVRRPERCGTPPHRAPPLPPWGCSSKKRTHLCRRRPLRTPDPRADGSAAELAAGVPRAHGRATYLATSSAIEKKKREPWGSRFSPRKHKWICGTVIRECLTRCIPPSLSPQAPLRTVNYRRVGLTHRHPKTGVGPDGCSRGGDRRETPPRTHALAADCEERRSLRPHGSRSPPKTLSLPQNKVCMPHALARRARTGRLLISAQKRVEVSGMGCQGTRPRDHRG